MNAALTLAALLTLGAARASDIPSGVYSENVTGSTLDLERLAVRTVALPAGVGVNVQQVSDSVETLVIVKEGRIRVTLGARSRELGPGSVAVVVPGDAYGLASSGDRPAGYHILTYRSRAPMDRERGRAGGGSFTVDWDSLVAKPSRTGARRDLFDRPTAAFRRFEIHASTLNAGLTNHAVHTHRAEELVVMLRGSARMSIGGSTHTIAAGDVAFLAADVPHNLVNTGTGPAEYFAIQGQP